MVNIYLCLGAGLSKSRLANVLYSIDAAVAPNRGSTAVERVDSSSTLSSIRCSGAREFGA